MEWSTPLHTVQTLPGPLYAVVAAAHLSELIPDPSLVCLWLTNCPNFFGSCLAFRFRLLLETLLGLIPGSEIWQGLRPPLDRITDFGAFAFDSVSS